MNKRLLIRIYAAICVLGFLPAIYPLANVATGAIFGSFPVQVFPHVQPFMYQEKRIELLAYVLTVPAIALYGFFTYLVSKRTSSDLTYSKRAAWGLLAVALIADALAWKYSQRNLNAVWAVVAAMPFLERIWNRSYEIYGNKSFSLGLSISSAAILVTMVAPFLFLRPHITCEYLDIPSVTLLSGSREVDTGKFLSENPQIGFMKADPRTGEYPDRERFPSVHIEKSRLLEALLEDQRDRVLTAVVEKIKFGTDTMGKSDDDGVASYNAESVVYDLDSHSLVAISKINDELKRRLLECVKPSEMAAIDELTARSAHIASTFTSRQYTTEEAKFILQNKNEFETGFLARRIIHHHNFLLGSIQELDKGRPVSEINLQYGYLFVWGMRWMLDKVGGVSYQSYVPLLYSFYVLYYMLAVFIVFQVTRNWAMAGIFLCISVAIQGLVGYEAMAIAPGMNPVRHFFDFAVIWLLFIYLRQGGTLPILAMCILCVLSILNNRQTGLFLSLAASFGVALKSCSSQKIMFFPLAFAVGFGLFSFFFSFKLSPGKDELSAYYAAGLCGFPTHKILMASMLGLCAATTGLLMTKWDELEPSLKILLIAITGYTLMMFLYYVWGGSKYHFYNYAPVYLFAGLLLIHCWIVSEKNPDDDVFRVRRMLGFLSISSSMVMLLCFANYGWLAFRYAATFKSHKSYEWDLPKARIVSTMAPDLFYQSIGLIKKYNPEPGIYIISEYDNFLPFLADKYSAMPFPDLQWFVNSELEKDSCVVSVKSANPKYIFADAAIGREFVYGVIDPHVPLLGGMQSEAILRAHRLRVLQDIFKEVKSGYSFKEKAGLLAVWERND